MNRSEPFDVAIAGAGPAGSSAAIRLAQNGARVLLADERKFPRAKLCGEFISPECLTHFRELGVLTQINAAGGAAVSRTVFYSRHGRNVAVPSEWFSSGNEALALSRSEMDYQLLQRAKAANVAVYEGAHVSPLVDENEQVHGIKVRDEQGVTQFPALVTIDATGRTRALSRHFDRNQRRKRKNSVVAFKVHLRGAHVSPGACEIYFYPQGYGGLTDVEGDVSNLCFMVAAEEVKRRNSDPDRVLHEVVMQNPRAAQTLAAATNATPWLSVSLETFGRRTLTPASGLLSVGDAAAFIDPFTGSGMLMAFESGSLAAETISRNLEGLRRNHSFDDVAIQYKTEYRRRFDRRLRVSGLLRRAAFVPYLDDVVITFLNSSSKTRRALANATRRSSLSEVKRVSP